MCSYLATQVFFDEIFDQIIKNLIIKRKMENLMLSILLAK